LISSLIDLVFISNVSHTFNHLHACLPSMMQSSAFILKELLTSKLFYLKPFFMIFAIKRKLA